MRINNKDFLQQRGSGLTETLLAIAIVGAIMPFAYKSAIDMSNNIADNAEAIQVAAWHDPVMVWVRKNQADWPSVNQIEFGKERLKEIGNVNHRLMQPYAGFIDKRTNNGGTMINAYIVFRPIDIKELRVANIAKGLGNDAAIVADGGEAVSQSGWSISSKQFSSGDLVYKISDILGDDDTYKYLHRTYLDDEELNTMYRDLDMVKNNILGVGNITAKTLNATNGNIWFADTPSIITAEVHFPEGASVDASKASFNSITVNGDVSGLRKITTAQFKGSDNKDIASWSMRGDAVIDYANINGSIHVQNDMIVRAESARTITGFAGVRAASVATPYLYADQLIFASGFGITISSELMYSNIGTPIKLGGWNFPSSTSPTFSTITLTQANNAELSTVLSVPSSGDLAPIMTTGWKDR